MLGHVYKDLCVTKFNRVIWVFFGLISIYSVIVHAGMSDADFEEKLFFKGFLVIMIIILLCLSNSVVIGTIKRDDDTNWQQLAASMPGGMKTYFRAKYICAGINMCCGLLTAYIYVIMNNIIWSDMKLGLYVPILIMALLNVFLASDIVVSCYYGAKRGVYIKGIVMFSLLMIPLIYGLFGDIGWFRSIDIDGMIVWYNEKKDLFGRVSVVAFAASIGVMAVSYVIGVKSLLRRKR